MINAFDIALVSLDPTIGSEIQKIRPCIVISPDSMNKYLRTVIIAPMTSKGTNAAFRVPVTWNDVEGLILLDQIRAIDKRRIVKSLGHIDKKTSGLVSDRLIEMFS